MSQSHYIMVQKGSDAAAPKTSGTSNAMHENPAHATETSRKQSATQHVR
jgi:hypothetical protein